MANITSQAPIRYCIDKMSAASYGVIIQKSGTESDFTKASEINGFNLSYSMPSGTSIKILFNASGDSNWFKLSSTGTAVNITARSPSYEILNTQGNSISELNALSDIPAFLGKKIRYAIALTANDALNAVPKIKLSVKALSSSQVLNTSEYSPEYDLGADGQISEVKFDASCEDTGKVNLYVQLRDSDGNLTDWMSIKDSAGRKARSIKLRADYSVGSVSGGSALLNSADIIYSDGSAVIIDSGSNTGSGEIISLTQDWYMPIRHCRMQVRHNPLIDSEIKAFVCFRNSPHVIKNEYLGIGTGNKTTYQLKNKDGVKYDTVRLFIDNNEVFSDWEFNSEAARITCTPNEGAIITCCYEWGWDSEEWHEMQLSSEYSLEDYDISEFRFSHDNNLKSVCAVKIQLINSEGNINREELGKGTGKTQTYKLSHRVKDGDITVYADNAVLSQKAYYLTDDTQYVRIAAPSGKNITAEYSWISEPPAVYQFAAVFSE